MTNLQHELVTDTVMMQQEEITIDTEAQFGNQVQFAGIIINHEVVALLKNQVQLEETVRPIALFESKMIQSHWSALHALHPEIDILDADHSVALDLATVIQIEDEDTVEAGLLILPAVGV